MNGKPIHALYLYTINYIYRAEGERRGQHELRFSAITLKYLSQHITYKLALSLTRQLKLTLLFLCLSPQANR